MDEKIIKYLDDWKNNNGVPVPNANGQPLFKKDYQINDDEDWVMLTVDFSTKKEAPYGAWVVASEANMAHVTAAVMVIENAIHSLLGI